MISEATPVVHADPLPDAVDVAVIGAGIIGTATSWFLAQRGAKVALIEKGRVAGEQSSRNWGWVRSASESSSTVARFQPTTPRRARPQGRTCLRPLLLRGTSAGLQHART